MPFFVDGINPQLEGKVFALRITQLPAEFLLISIFQDFQVKRDGSRKMQHIVSVTLDGLEETRQIELRLKLVIPFPPYSTPLF
jgi:hypothetical protein